MSIEEASKALSKAKIALMADHRMVFISVIMFSLKYRWDSSIPTACTNGFTIKINPDFFLKFTPAQRITMLLHEVWHVALKHCLRMSLGNINLKRYNAAADYYINPMLKSQGFAELINDTFHWLYDGQFIGMSTMEIYDALPESFVIPKECEDISNDPSDLDEESKTEEDLKEHLDALVVKAYVQTKMTNSNALGYIPAEMRVQIERMVNPSLPWYVILRRYVNAYAKSDYSWSRPNRRYMPNHYLPSLYSESLGEFVECFDLSGSVSDAEIHSYATQTYHAFKALNPKQITLITFDTEIHEIIKITNAEQIFQKELTGRGGTCVIEIMEWAKKHKPVVMTVFTDGDFGFHNVEDPKVPIVWVVHNNQKFNPPFGRVIHHEITR